MSIIILIYSEMFNMMSYTLPHIKFNIAIYYDYFNNVMSISHAACMHDSYLDVQKIKHVYYAAKNYKLYTQYRKSHGIHYNYTSKVLKFCG